MSTDVPKAPPQANLQLALGTVSFAACFAAWGLISAFAPRFREAFHLTATQPAFLVAVPVLLGSLLRIVTGMLASAGGCQLLGQSSTGCPKGCICSIDGCTHGSRKRPPCNRWRSA